MRDLIVFLIVAFCLPMAFRRPYIGLMLFSWLAYMRPQDLCWGFARSMRFSYFVGLTMLVGWIVNDSDKRRFFRVDARTSAMIALAVLMMISLTMARDTDSYVMTYFLEFVKIIVIALFTTGQIDTKQKLRMILWLIAGCLTFYGIKSGILGLLSGGRPILRGPGGMLEDNNDFALAMVLSIPLTYYLGSTAKDLRIKTFFPVAIALTLITILLTHSRGAFLATSMVALAIAKKSGRLIQAGLGLVTLGVLFFAFAPAHVKERIASIGQGGAESSAGARIRAWTIALRMIEANPVFGVGMRNFRANWKDHSYGLTDPDGGFAFVAHNSYLQIWAEGGSIAFAVYLSLLASVFISCRWLRNVSFQRPDLAWIGNYARMFEVVTLAFMVGATFLNRGHFDLIYHLFALVSCTVWIAKVEYAKGPEALASRGAASAEAAPAVAGSAGDVAVRWGVGATGERTGGFGALPAIASPSAEPTESGGQVEVRDGSSAPSDGFRRLPTPDAAVPGPRVPGDPTLRPRWGR